MNGKSSERDSAFVNLLEIFALTKRTRPLPIFTFYDRNESFLDGDFFDCVSIAIIAYESAKRRRGVSVS